MAVVALEAERCGRWGGGGGGGRERWGRGRPDDGVTFSAICYYSCVALSTVSTARAVGTPVI